MLLLLLACQPATDKESPSESDPTVDTGTDCGAGTAPTLATDRWEATGQIPAGGILSFAQGPHGVPVYAGSHNSGLWSSQNQGDSWTQLPVLVTHTLADLAISPSDPQTLYRSSGGILERTTDGGQHWTPLPLGYVSPSGAEAVFAIAIAPYDALRVYGVTDRGTASVSVDGGDHFEAVSTLPVKMDPMGDDPFNTHSWHLLPDDHAGGRIVFTDGSAVYTSDDGMRTWDTRLIVPLGGRSLLRDPTNSQHLLLGATGLAESFDEGSTWMVRDLGASLRLGAWAEDGSWLAFASADTLFVSADRGQSFVGTPFSWIETEAMTILDSKRLMLSWDNGTVVSDDRGATWTEASVGLIDPGMAVVAPHPVCANQVFTASRCSGGIYQSEDWGSTWTHVDHYFHYVMRIAYDPQNAATIWAVSDDSLLLSEDGGATWRDAYVKHHFHGFAIHPNDSNTLLMGTVGSGEWADTAMHVLRSTDHAATWTDSSSGLPNSNQSAHTILYWPGDPSVVLLGTYKGGDASHTSGDGIGLYRSTDSGQTWSFVGGLPVKNIAWLEAVPTGVVAATENGLYRSTDQGQTWTFLTGPTGMMLSVAFHGPLGLALAQSGKVWRSDDGGDSWREVDADLPANPSTWLAQIAIAADNTVAWATVFDNGVYRIGL